MAVKVLVGTPALNGSSGVESVTGDGVDNIDPKNPVLSFPNTSEVTETTDKNYVTDDEKTKLDGIEAGAEVNTINSKTTGEPTGSDVVLNVVSLTQSEYDISTPVSTTFYLITDA